MMKRSLYVLSVLLTVTLMFSMLYSCGNSPTPTIREEVRDEIERQEERKRREEQRKEEEKKRQEEERKRQEEERKKQEEERKRQEEAKRKKQEERGKILKTAASQMVNVLMQEISPKSGRDPKAVVYLENIYFWEKENCIAAKVLLTWRARDFWRDVPYGECQVTGTLYVYLPIRDIDVTTAVLGKVSYNQHLIRVATSQDIADLNAGIRITVR